MWPLKWNIKNLKIKKHYVNWATFVFVVNAMFIKFYFKSLIYLHYFGSIDFSVSATVPFSASEININFKPLFCFSFYSMTSPQM